MTNGAVPLPSVLDDTWSRFLSHWGAATVGFFLRSLLPVLKAWTDPKAPISYPRWWAALFFAAAVSLVGGLINSNLPSKPRELLKSVGLGFALDAAALLAKISIP